MPHRRILVSFVLCIQNDQTISIGLNNRTWYGILQMAEENGWNPMGTVSVHPAAVIDTFPWDSLGLPDEQPGEYWADETRLVLFEDALNLADALDVALHQYLPQFLPSLSVYALQDSLLEGNGSQPSIGALQLVADFCTLGSFYIQKL